ncbi:MAG TPA: ATP-binding SpoIIE family protein phosphatase [Vicinamibacterales bacterium]|nr:ATP-binding SpoIIE family protein phosphatase [Vicinamibacterales bacterium]
MTQAEHRVCPVVEGSQPSAVRAAARESAGAAGFDETDAYRAGIVATELATNLVKHATDGGSVLVRSFSEDGCRGVELIAIDRGPGVPSVSESLRDGHSTAGSSGTGLGAIQRMSDEFDIHSQPGRGTAIMARLFAGRRRPPAAPLSFGAVSVAMVAEDPCGDAWAVRQRDRSMTVFVADGLGHGLFAAEAARAAVTAWTKESARPLADALAVIHDALRHTRGAAGALAHLDLENSVVRFAGVGNICGSITNNGVSRQMVSHNGTLGHQAHHFREFAYPWSDDGVFVMHSDGLTTHWTLDGYPGLARRHPAVIAAVLYRDFNRGRDDATVLVCRATAE